VTAKKPQRKPSLDEIKAVVEEVARVGQAFVDGDLCRQAYQPHAETFMTGDDMDFNPQTTVPLKKTLLRLERVSRLPCGTTLWRRRPDDPGSGEALLFGSASSPLAGGKPGNRGYKPPRMTREMAAGFLKGRTAWRLNYQAGRAARTMADRGQAIAARGLKRPCIVERFVPIRDSMGEVAAVLEVFAAAVTD
jgi:hypothetical protein